MLFNLRNFWIFCLKSMFQMFSTSIADVFFEVCVFLDFFFLRFLNVIFRGHWLCMIDWLSCGFTSHSTKKQVISETFPQANLLAWYGQKTKPNTTKSTHSPIKRNVLIQNKQKTKAMFSRLLRHLSWKRRGSILKDINKQTIYRVARKKRPELSVTITARILYGAKFPLAHS